MDAERIATILSDAKDAREGTQRPFASWGDIAANEYVPELCDAIQASQATNLKMSKDLMRAWDEREALRAERDALQAEVTRLQEADRALKFIIERQREDLGRLASQVTDLTPYIQHRDACRRMAPQHCDCKLNDVRARLTPTEEPPT